MLRRTSMLFRPMARGLSTAAALPEKPPVALFGIAGRYTNALYSAAAKKGDLLKVEADLGTLSGILESSKAVKAFTMDPGVSRIDKAKLLVGSLGDSGACATTKNMVAVLCESGRMKELPTVMKMYSTLMSAAKGEVSALITSSHELEEAQMKAIRSQIADISGSDLSKVQIDVRVDPGLLSGYTIEIGDKFVDYSSATQLKKLAVALGL